MQVGPQLLNQTNSSIGSRHLLWFSETDLLQSLSKNLSYLEFLASTKFGVTRIVLGSNTWPKDPDSSGTYAHIPIEIPAERIAFIIDSCYHSADVNASGCDREGLTLNYCNGSMRQQENLMLGVPPPRMMSFSETPQDPRVETTRRYSAKIL